MMYYKDRTLLKAFIVVGIIATVLCSKAPRFISKPKESYVVNEGGRVKLKCLVTGANDPNHNRTLTAWRKEGVPPRNSVIRKSPTWERYKVKNGKYLRIRDIQKGDAGRYWCIAKNQYGMINAPINLTVTSTDNNNTYPYHDTSKSRTRTLKPTVVSRGPRFRSKQTSHHAIKKAKGKELKLSCQAKGNPRPTVTWLKDRRSFKKSRRRFKFTSWELTIKKLKHKDSGIYRCFVWNRFGNITRTFYVQVIDDSVDPPDIDVPPIIQENLLKNATALEGQTVTFTCAALSDKFPQFAWVKWISFYDSKYEVLNSSSPNVRFVGETSIAVSGKTSYSQKLKLLNVSKSDQGQYTCFVGHDGRRKIVSSHVFLTVHQLKPTVDLTKVQGLTKRNTSSPSYLIGGIEIPLAAIIAVPAALSTILIAAIIWCYIQTAKHRYQRHAKAAAFAQEANNGIAMNGTFKGHQTIKNMETFTNGHILHRTMPIPEINQYQQAKSYAGIVCEPEMKNNPEVRHKQEMGSKEQLRKMRTENSEVCHSRNNLTISTHISTENSIGSSDRTNRSLGSDFTDEELSQDSSSKMPDDLNETICTTETPNGVCAEDGLRTTRKCKGDTH